MLRGLNSLRQRENPSGSLGPCLGIVLVAAAAGFTLGCSTISANLGDANPDLRGAFPDDYVEIVRRWIDNDFHDISIVTSLQVSLPVAGHATRWPSSKRLNGWYSKVTFKARDSIGTSKGKLAYSVLLHEGAIISHRKLLY